VNERDHSHVGGKMDGKTPTADTNPDSGKNGGLAMHGGKQAAVGLFKGLEKGKRI